LTDRESGVTRVSMVGARIGVWNGDLEIFSKRDRRRSAAEERRMNDSCIVIVFLRYLARGTSVIVDHGNGSERDIDQQSG